MFRAGTKTLLYIFALIAPLVEVGLSCGVAHAATFYVATTGSDNNFGLSLSSPFKTIQKAADTVRGGDTVLVRGGVYAGFRLTNLHPSSGDWVTFKPYAEEKATIDSAGFLGAGIRISGASYIVIDGFEITQSNYVYGADYSCDLLNDPNGSCRGTAEALGNAGRRGITVDSTFHSNANTDTHHIIIRNNEIHHNGDHGILAGTGAHPTNFPNGLGNYNFEVLDNEIHDNGIKGLTAGYGTYISGTDHIIKGNILYGNNGQGMRLGNTSTNNNLIDSTIEENISYDSTGPFLFSNGNVETSSGSGFVIHGGRGNLVRNNVAYGNYGSGAQVRSLDSANPDEISNNTFYHNGVYGMQLLGGAVGKNNISHSNAQRIPAFELSLHDNSVATDNLVSGNGLLIDTRDTSSASNNLLNANPQFVNAAGNDFHLQSSSEAIDAGATLLEATTDFHGNPRPQGNGYDIGAFEFVPANADFNGDGDVDGSDFLNWQRGFGTGITLQEGDANVDNIVDDADLAIWENQFGSAAALAGSATVVPEPASLTLVGMVLALSVAGRSPIRKSRTGRQRFVLCGQKVPLVMLALMTLCMSAATCFAHREDVDSLPNYLAAVSQESDQQEKKSTAQLEKTMTPLLRTVDLKLGESQLVELCDGKKVTVKLLDLIETRDTVRDAIRDAQVSVEIDGKPITLKSGNYHLPVTIAGVQIDCPITHGYYSNTAQDSWGLDKDARLRLWPADSPLVHPGTFGYPVKQRWFASHTWMSNQPVDGGERFAHKIYYHNALDFGGTEGMVEVIAATDGLVVASGEDVLDGIKLEDTPIKPRYDVVNILDRRGWYQRYSHLKEIDKNIKPGQTIRRGDRIGVLGKEGSSGGWSHLHFGIWSRQPSGKWGTQDGYAFVWEAYLRQYKPKLIANARPYHLTRVGEKVVLDGGLSWCVGGKIANYEWIHDDGSIQSGVRVEQTYPRPGVYSEILKITDPLGRVDYDFTSVLVVDNRDPGRCPPYILPNCSPTFGIKAGDPVTFKVRSYYFTGGHEIWDFGDGSPHVEVQSKGNVDQHAKHGYAVTTHRFSKPGQYVIRVERTGDNGDRAVGHLQVRVGKQSSE